MFQDLDVYFDNSFQQTAPQQDSAALIYRGDSVLARTEDAALCLPSFAELPEQADALPFCYAFTLGSRSFFLADWAEDEATLIRPNVRTGAASSKGEGFAFVSSKEFRGMGPKEAVFAAAVGESLHRWYGANRFCGRCGKPMEDSSVERARVCPACGLTVYPKISPAVIVAVTDRDRLLLTKYRGRAFKRYALVAGFAEIGESIEDTVRREVLEETGLRVKNLRFYKSQPWVFTDSLLMGFWCELDGSDAVTLQKSELSEADWHPRAELPTDHSGISLTGEMIELFRRGEER
jgi:NTP pyrophosphohydrolases containing a Zn-finger, probably nucleic-acid-binding